MNTVGDDVWAIALSPETDRKGKTFWGPLTWRGSMQVVRGRPVRTIGCGCRPDPVMKTDCSQQGYEGG